MITACLAFGASAAQGACLAGTCTCTVAADGPAFGAYDSLRRTTVAAVGAVSVTCRAEQQTDVSYDIALGAGGSGDLNDRVMRAGVESLHYNLYTSAAHTAVWGDGSGATALVSDAYAAAKGAPDTRSYPIYGLVPGGQVAIPGSYQDTLVVTVAY